MLGFLWGFLYRYGETFFITLLAIGTIVAFFIWIYETIYRLQWDVEGLRERVAVLESKQGGSFFDSLFMSAMPYAAAANQPPPTPPPEEETDTTTFEVKNLNENNRTEVDAV